MHHLADFSYHSLELLCRKEAALASTAEVRGELLRMAIEYKRLADLLDQPRGDEPPGKNLEEQFAR